MNISVSGLSKKYQSFTALHPISFEVQSGDVLGILGANGAGKTTLLRMLTGIVRPTEGSIMISQQPISNSLIINHIGYLPEERGLYKNMKAIDCLLFLAALKNVSKSKALDFVQEKSKALEIDFDLNKPVGSFSKGMQQKIQLIAATVHRPSILILDEPFSGLDPMNAQVIKREISTLSQSGTTILMSTHRMDTFEDLCKSFLFLRKGSILAQGAKSELLPRKSVYKLMLTGPYDFTADELVYSQKMEGHFEYLVNHGGAVNELLKKLISANVGIISASPQRETLEDVFIQLNKNFDHA